MRNTTYKYHCLFILAILVLGIIHSKAQVWQWSVPVTSVVSTETNDHPQAFLWIPENCKTIKAVVFAQHNMVEEGVLEHVYFRATMRDLGMAEIWVTPGINMSFDFHHAAGRDFNTMMQALAKTSGYAELATVPVIPMGHSAYATFPWNFAAWNPGRTLAIISIHGDAPQTRLTGYGGKNVPWGDRNIDGVPALFIMGEYEWWEDRILPGFEYVKKHPNSPISFFADAGHGHFDYSDELIAYLSMFIRKAVTYRLPTKINDKPAVTLKPIDPENGWLMDRWFKDSLPAALPAPYRQYKGNRHQASWVFDEDMANQTEGFYANARGKINQYIGFIQNNNIVYPKQGHAQFNIPFTPLKDGISFHLRAFFADTSKTRPVKDHATTPLIISRICGPVKKINDTTFQLAFYRVGFNNPKRSNDIWLLASNKGDGTFKSTVQQLDMHFPLWNKEGKPQVISFPPLPGQNAAVKTLPLNATSSAGVPVHYYVKEGPAFIKDDEIYFTGIPPRSKFPVKVTIVAWQYGSSVEPKLQSAIPVEQSFYLLK